MAIKLTDEAAEYPYVFMISQSICQQQFETEAESPYYTLSIIWSYYKINEDSSVSYDPNGQYSYYDDNFHTTATSDYMKGDATHATTLATQEASIAKIVADETAKALVVL